MLFAQVKNIGGIASVTVISLTTRIASTTNEWIPSGGSFVGFSEDSCCKLFWSRLLELAQDFPSSTAIEKVYLSLANLFDAYV